MEKNRQRNLAKAKGGETKGDAKGGESPDDLKERQVLSSFLGERAQIYLALGENEKAQTDISSALSLNPTAVYYLTAAKAAHRLADYEEASKYCELCSATAKAMQNDTELREESAKLSKLCKVLQSKLSRSAYNRHSGCPTYNFSVVVVQHTDGRLLAVKETRNRGWWLPAGFVDPGENFIQAAHRETLEEAGIKVKLEVILRVEHSVAEATHARMRVIFYARPIDNTPPKTKPDEESEGASWVSLDDLQRLNSQSKLRGHELLIWGQYLAAGGKIFPLHILTEEGARPPGM